MPEGETNLLNPHLDELLFELLILPNSGFTMPLNRGRYSIALQILLLEDELSSSDTFLQDVRTQAFLPLDSTDFIFAVSANRLYLRVVLSI